MAVSRHKYLERVDIPSPFPATSLDTLEQLCQWLNCLNGNNLVHSTKQVLGTTQQAMQCAAVIHRTTGPDNKFHDWQSGTYSPNEQENSHRVCWFRHWTRIQLVDLINPFCKKTRCRCKNQRLRKLHYKWINNTAKGSKREHHGGGAGILSNRCRA